MKNLTLNCLLIILGIIFSTPAEAQFIKKLKQAASQGMENAIEQKVEEEAEKMMRKEIENQLARMYGENGQSGPIEFDMDKILESLGEEIPTESSYDFLGFVDLELISTDENGKAQEPIYLKSFLGESTSYTGMAMPDPNNPSASNYMIFDTNNKASILLMENEGTKSSFAYKLDFDQIANDSSGIGELDYKASDFSITKTGNTKDLLGYTCDEYHVKSSDGEGNYWITEKMIEGTNSFWSTNSPFATQKMQESYADIFTHMPKGNFMEMDFTSSDGSNIKMKVTDIQASQPKSFLMSEYPNMMQSMKQ